MTIPRLRMAVRKGLMPLYRNELHRRGVYAAGRSSLIGRPIVAVADGSEIYLGHRVTLVSDSYWTALGVSRPVILRTLRSGARIRIGSDSGLSGTAICAAREVVVGDRVLIGADCMIVDTDFHPLLPDGRRWAPIPEPVETDRVQIGNDVFIGARSVILKGVTVGDGAVIGAGSVVVKNVAPRAVVAGNPARKISSPEDD